MTFITLLAKIAATPFQIPALGQAFCACVHELPKFPKQAHFTDEETDLEKQLTWGHTASDEATLAYRQCPL